MLSRILSDGMVIFTEVLATLTKLLNVCEQFSTFMIRTSRYQIDAEFSYKILKSQPPSFDEYDEAQQEPKQISTADTFEETIKKMDLQFSALLVSFIEKVTVVQFEASSEKRSALLDRLNYNSFYDNVIQMSKTTFTSGSLASEDSMKTTG
ncbi:gamma-tubulin complex component 2 homolog isoform X1 [Artemia franciscana]